MARDDLTDQEWVMIGPLLSSELGRWAPPPGDNRRFLNGMLRVLRTGCPWRDMHERYGKWNSVYVRFRCWAEQGVWDAPLQTLVDLGLTDNWQHMLDSTVVRAHSQATGAKRGGGSCGSFWSVTQRLYEQNPRPMRQSGASSWLYSHRRADLGLQSHRRPDEAACPAPKAMLADRDYDSDSFRLDLLIHRILPVIPSRKGRNVPQKTDWLCYRDRNRTERMFNHLKQMRRIATRYDKTALSFISFLNIAAARLWIGSFVNVT